MMTIANWISVLGFIGGVGTTLLVQLIFVIKWYSESRLKEYAAKRDFEHLRRSQEQISANIAQLQTELEEVSTVQETVKSQVDILSRLLGSQNRSAGI